MHKKIHSIFLTTALVISLPSPTWAADKGAAPTATEAIILNGQPFEQDFIITAYYSPLPGQCGYVMGDIDADKYLNGQGTNGADGTPVYAGMAAAPPAYPFGTRLVLPGIGTVTVHDRGGAIQEGEKAHRLDLWVGSGEEGLARALKFGVQHVHAIVYPTQSTPQPAESMDLTSLPAPTHALAPYLTDNAKISDCEAMLTFGSPITEKMREYYALHMRFSFEEFSFGNGSLVASMERTSTNGVTE